MNKLGLFGFVVGGTASFLLLSRATRPVIAVDDNEEWWSNLLAQPTPDEQPAPDYLPTHTPTCPQCEGFVLEGEKYGCYCSFECWFLIHGMEEHDWEMETEEGPTMSYSDWIDQLFDEWLNDWKLQREQLEHDAFVQDMLDQMDDETYFRTQGIRR